MRTTEFTTPLVGTPYYRSVGIIKVYDEYGNNYNVGEIIYEIFDEENYQYIFKPYWDLIECIPKEVFSGIPGINMDIKKELYYRVNMTPVFISQRSPSKNRENLKELLDSVGLDYYDRFEWMLRTETRCGDDNFFVVRKPNVDNKHKKINEINSRYLNPDDMVEIERLGDITKNNSELIHEMFKLLQSGAQIYIKDENRYLEITERKIMLYLLKNIIKSLEENKKRKIKDGIERAKLDKKYLGRKPIELDDQLLKQTAIAFLNKQLTEQQAMENLNIKSRATFYRKIKEYR